MLRIPMTRWLTTGSVFATAIVLAACVRPAPDPRWAERERAVEAQKRARPAPAPKPDPRTQSAKVVPSWPERSRAAAEAMTAKYGPANESSPTMLIWRDRGPWKRIVVYRDVVAHNFPTAHEDVITQVIAYKVPKDRVDEVIAFDGSLVIDRTRGELSATCDSEAMNFLTLNLAHEVALGLKDVVTARQFHADGAAALARGKTWQFTQGLAFHVDKSGTADPDVEVEANAKTGTATTLPALDGTADGGVPAAPTTTPAAPAADGGVATPPPAAPIVP